MEKKPVDFQHKVISRYRKTFNFSTRALQFFMNISIEGERYALEIVHGDITGEITT